MMMMIVTILMVGIDGDMNEANNLSLFPLCLMSGYLPTIRDHRAGPQVIQTHTKSYFNTSTHGSILYYKHTQGIMATQ